MSWDAAAAWAHIDSLAAEHDIKVKLVKGIADAEAYVSARTVYVANLTSPKRYLVALHELGHIASDVARRAHLAHSRSCIYGDATTDEHIMASEGAAWAWAFEHVDDEVLPEITDRLWRACADMLMSHTRHAST